MSADTKKNNETFRLSPLHNLLKRYLLVILILSAMEIQEYLEQRIQSQIKYYSSKSRANKNFYHWFKTMEVMISVTIPFLTGYLKDNDYIKYFIAILSLLLAILTGLEVLFKFQDKWISFRTTSESLKQEMYMYLNSAGPYKADQTLSNLTERIESVIAKENSTWNQLMNKKDDQKT